MIEKRNNKYLIIYELIQMMNMSTVLLRCYLIKKLSVLGTPRGVYISVGVNPTRQLTIRTVVKGIVNSVGGYKS